MVTTLELQRRGLRYAVSVDAAATNASLLDLQRAGLPYAVEVADGATMASRAALEARGLAYFVPVLVDATPVSKASLAAQGLRYAVQVDADILPADRLVLERQGLRYFVEVDSSGNSVAAGAVGGAALLVGETDGFATDFTYATDASRVAVKAASVTTSYALDSFYANAGTSPKMVYDVAGALVWSPHNMFLRSQELNNAYWAISNLTVGANAIAAPDGSITADAVIPANGSFQPSFLNNTAVTVVVGQTYTYSAYVKNGSLGNNWFRPSPNTVSGVSAWFNLATGAKGTVIGSGTSTITSVGDGWYRITVTFTADGTSCYCYQATTGVDGVSGPITGDGTSPACYIWGAQINRGSVALPYLPTTTAARNGLAVDYDPVTHAARGLLCEPAATNLLLNNATLSTQSVTVSAVAYTLSFWGTGTVTLTGVSTAGPLVGTGASDRVSLTFTPTAGSLTCTVSGTVTRGQLETGTVATSPIPTFAASATRAADSYNCSAASIGYSATVGSWWAEMSHIAALSGTPRIVGTNAAASPLYYTAATTPGMLDTTGLTKTTTTIVGSTHKVACAFASGDRAFTADGLAAATDAGATSGLLAPTTLYFGTGSSTPMNGYIRKVRYLPRRVTNADLATQTT